MIYIDPIISRTGGSNIPTSVFTIGNKYHYLDLGKNNSRSIPDIIGYTKEGQTEADRRKSLSYLYQTEFRVEMDARLRLRKYVEDWGGPFSKWRFVRICSFLFLRGRSIIEKQSNVEGRVAGTHPSSRKIFETFEDGIWFTDEFGAKYDATSFGIQHRQHLDEPLLMFVTVEGQTPLMRQDLGFLDKSHERYNSHAELISKRFEIMDFINEEEFYEEWGSLPFDLDPEAEAAIAKAYLNDHIAPMRADIEDNAGIPGNSARRFRLDEGKA